jgi:hypothetical protein
MWTLPKFRMFRIFLNINSISYSFRSIANQMVLDGLRYSDSTSYFKKFSSSKCKQTVCLHYGLDFQGKWQYNFLFSHLKELLKLHINFFYRFFISCLVLEIFSLEVTRCPPSWINVHLINIGDVTTGINHIKVFVADQILIGRCFKGFEWSKSRQSIVLSAKWLVVV